MRFSKSSLFCENFGVADADTPSQFLSHTENIFGCNVTFGDVHDTAYATVDAPRLWSLTDPTSLIRAASATLRRITLNAVSFRPERILVAAFGNPRIRADSLGQAVADRVIPSDTDPRVVVLRTGVPAAVGMDSVHTVSLFAADMKAQLILCVDALAACRPERLGSVIQITDGGCDPGGGVGNPSRSISLATLGIPTVAVGIPTVLVQNDLLFTVADVDLLVEKASAVIAAAVNDLIYGRNFHS